MKLSTMRDLKMEFSFLSVSVHSKTNFLFNEGRKEFNDWLDSLSLCGHWLDSLEAGDSYAQCEEIFSVLQHLDKVKLSVSEKLEALNKISFYLGKLSGGLEFMYLSGSFPLKQKQQRHFELMVLAYVELINHYFDIIEQFNQVNFSDKVQAKILYQALNSLGWLAILVAMIYTKPQQGFWRRCYQIIEIAEARELLEMKVMGWDKKPQTISSIFRQILLFDIFDKEQFLPKEIKSIYLILDAIISQIQFVGCHGYQQTSHEVWLFCLAKDIAPLSSKKQNNFAEQEIRCFDVNATIESLWLYLKIGCYHDKAFTLTEQLLFYKALKSLKDKEKRSFTRIRKQYLCTVIVDFDKIIDFLLGRDGMAVLQSKLINNDFSMDDIEVISFDNELSETETMTQKSAEFYIINSSIQGYGIQWNMCEVQLQIGVFLGVVNDKNNQLEIAQVRRISRREESCLLGVELLSLHSKAVYMTQHKQERKGEWVILLHDQKKKKDYVLFKQKPTKKSIYLAFDDELKNYALAHISYVNDQVYRAELTETSR